MVHGTLEVLLVGAKGLENTDYLCTHRLIILSFFLLFVQSARDLPSSIVSMEIGTSGIWTSNNWSIAQLTLVGRWINKLLPRWRC